MQGCPREIPDGCMGIVRRMSVGRMGLAAVVAEVFWPNPQSLAPDQLILRRKRL